MALSPTSSALSGERIRPPSVLLVEDDDEVRKLLEETLQIGGFSVQSIPLASQIFETLSGGTHEVLVLDLGMPQGTLQGMEALTLLRSIEAWRELPVIILSAFSDVVNREITSRLGVVDILGKPFDVEELVAALQRVRFLDTPARNPE
jgi:DNA-binding response OmpR family regulator